MASSNAKNPSRAVLALSLCLVAVALPLSMWAANHTVSISPRAYGPESQITLSGDLSLKLPLGNTINCQANEPCTATFVGNSNNNTDPLNLDINFLPQGLKQNTCETSTILKNSTVTCNFSGTPTRTGEFKLLVAVTNHTGQTAQQIVSLNIR
jgi:hypothetical protein